MGTLAELVKDAEAAKEAKLPDPSSSPDEFLKAVEELRQRATEPATSPADVARMTAPVAAGGFGLPSARVEGRSRALSMLGKIGIGAATAGAILRLLRAGAERARRQELVEDVGPYAGVPTREITVPFSVVKKGSTKKAGWALPALAGTAIAAPTVARAAGVRASEALGAGAEKVRGGVGHLFRATGSPWDEPWIYPAAVLGSIGATYLGYKGVDAILNALRRRRAARELEQARQEFEDALASQYQQSELAEQAGVKYSSAGAVGCMADVLARSHISGELAEQLEKFAQEFQPTEKHGPLWQYTRGLGSKTFGLYMAALTALALASAAGGYHLAKSREGKRKQYEAASELLRRRRLAEPPRVVVEPAA